MRINPAMASRYVCMAIAAAVVLFQLLSFARNGVHASDWGLYLVVALAFWLVGAPPKPDENSAAKNTPSQSRASKGSVSRRSAPDASVSQDVRSPEILDIERKLLTLNGKVLSMEIMWRARNMIHEIPKPFDTEEGYVTSTDGPKLLEYSRLREKTWLLCFGLVAIRRAGTDLDYVNSEEFLEMWQQTFNSMTDEAVFPQAGLGFTIYPEEMVHRFVYDLDAVKHFVIDAAKAAGRGEAGGAKPLLDWIGEQGLELSEPQLIRNALRTLEEWKANSPASAYPE
ncbi:hypothetical protein GCM10010520_62940 [Rhizobium viscosum]|uniref:TerB family tellurite resistance protein n=1 Tax=Rhizobium viscosum TaxID=1673 RepID=A0ABR9IUY4_RHIVS|nr:hypothetical protein [Rhizobium viscosum]MBE1507019.1 hypothetical protein [Rhizobium viscosum]